MPPTAAHQPNPSVAILSAGHGNRACRQLLFVSEAEVKQLEKLSGGRVGGRAIGAYAKILAPAHKGALEQLYVTVRQNRLVHTRSDECVSYLPSLHSVVQ